MEPELGVRGPEFSSIGMSRFFSIGMLRFSSNGSSGFSSIETSRFSSIRTSRFSSTLVGNVAPLVLAYKSLEAFLLKKANMVIGFFIIYK